MWNNLTSSLARLSNHALACLDAASDLRANVATINASERYFRAHELLSVDTGSRDQHRGTERKQGKLSAVADKPAR